MNANENMIPIMSSRSMEGHGIHHSIKKIWED